ncbi:MAG: heavy metal translocating P-type ATPase metal-binding domain-containing protein, partial [Planctomycetota bacterium]
MSTHSPDSTRTRSDATRAPAVTATVTEQVACTHCQLPVPRGLVRPGEAEQFCCQGCRIAYQVIHECGLEAFYQYRDDDTPDH